MTYPLPEHREDFMKICGNCGDAKPLTEYYRDKSSSDGYASQCKECKRAYRREHYQKNRERTLRVNKLYRDKNKEKIAYMDAAYRERNKEAIKLKKQLYYQTEQGRAARARAIAKNKLRYKVAKQLNQAVKYGKIKKPSNCSACGRAADSRHLHGHHEDYSKPYDVIWLCHICHKDLHLQRRRCHESI